MGLDEATAGRVVQVVASCCTGQDIESVELRIVSDSQRLASLAAEPPTGNPTERENAIHAELHTESARRKARNLIQA